MIRGWVELSHRIPIHNVDSPILACTNRQVHCLTRPVLRRYDAGVRSRRNPAQRIACLSRFRNGVSLAGFAVELLSVAGYESVPDLGRTKGKILFIIAATCQGLGALFALRRLPGIWSPPTNDERVRITSPFRSVVERCPSKIVYVTYSGYGLRTELPLPKNVCLAFGTSSSGSEASIHQLSMPSLKSVLEFRLECPLRRGIEGASPGLSLKATRATLPISVRGTLKR